MKKEDTMHNIRIILFLLLSAPLLLSCGKGERAVCIAAYEKATVDVLKAESSEDLLEISYALSLELQGVDVVDRKGNVANARREFENALKSKEIEFYSSKHKKR